MKNFVLAVLFLVLAACTTTTPQATVARVEIISGTPLFTANGQTTTFIAQAFDQANKPINSSITFSSSNPGQIRVSATGEAQALVDLGSSAISAEAGGIQSAPIMAVVAKPSTGTVLLTDAQILGVPQLISSDPANPFNSTMKVKLDSSLTLAPGTLFISSQSKALAGKVISSQLVSDGLEVTFKAAKIQEVFQTLKLGIETDAKSLPLDFKTLLQPSRLERRSDGSMRLEYPAKRFEREIRADKEFALGPFECKIEGKVELGAGDSISLEIKPELKLTLEGNVGDGQIKDMTLKLEGKLTGTLFGGLRVTSSMEGSVACRAIVFKLRLPVFGPISFMLSPIIPVGLGLELKGTVTGPNLQLGVQGKASATLIEGFSYRDGKFFDLSNFQIDKSLVPKLKVPRIEDLKLDTSTWIHVYSGLWASIAALYDVEIIDALLGIEAAASFAFEKPQAKDPEYASNYDLKFKGEIKPGEHLNSLLEYLFGKDGLKISATLTQKLKESPTGVATADKTQVSAGEKVKFNVNLDAANLEFPLIGYNVSEVQFFRIRNDGPAEKLATRLAAPGMKNFDWEWTATASDVGINDFYVFVNTKGVLDGFPLEINKDSKMRVIVTGEGFVSVSISGSRNENFVAPASGSQSSSVNANWRFDPTDRKPLIQLPGMIFGQPTPGFGMYYYKPSLTGSVTHKRNYASSTPCECGLPGSSDSGNTFDYASSSANISDSLSEFSVLVQMQGDGSYTGGIYFPNFDFSGTYTGTETSNAGCPNEPRDPVNKNIMGDLKQSPIADASFSGKIDLSKETLLQGSLTLTDKKVSIATGQSGAWEVPVTVTVTWQLDFAASSNDLNSSNILPMNIPMPVRPSSSNQQTQPWNGISPMAIQSKQPRC